MIVCVTPNVAVDRSYVLPRLQLGTVLRSKQTVVAAGGKGLNVARAVNILGGDAFVMGILGGRSGELVAELTAKEALPARWTWAMAETRNCAILIGEDGTPATVINDRGGLITIAEWLQFIHDIVETVTAARLAAPVGVHSLPTPLAADEPFLQPVSAVCICGSLPPGPPAHAPADLIEAILATATPVWLDASGVALARALDAQPTGIKINDEEAGAFLGRHLSHLDDVYEAASELRRCGIENVIITLGTRGALFSSPAGEFHLRAPAIQAISAVGSGDAFLAGLLVAKAQQRADRAALAWGVAAGAANALMPGGGIFARAAFDDLLAQLL